MILEEAKIYFLHQQTIRQVYYQEIVVLNLNLQKF